MKLSNETFKVILHDTYPEDNEYRELHLTFSKDFLNTKEFKDLNVDTIPEYMLSQDIEHYTETGIFLFLHNRKGPSIERYIWINGKLQLARCYHNYWVDGHQIPFDDLQEILLTDKQKKYVFKNNQFGLSKKALAFIKKNKINIYKSFKVIPYKV